VTDSKVAIPKAGDAPSIGQFFEGFQDPKNELKNKPLNINL